MCLVVDGVLSLICDKVEEEEGLFDYVVHIRRNSGRHHENSSCKNSQEMQPFLIAFSFITNHLIGTPQRPLTLSSIKRPYLVDVSINQKTDATINNLDDVTDWSFFPQITLKMS